MSRATPIGTSAAMVRMRRSSSPSPSSWLSRHHRAVQVEQDAVAAARDGVADAAGDVLEGGVVDRAARPGRGGDRDHDLGAGGVGELDEGGERRAGARVRGAAPRRLPAARRRRRRSAPAASAPAR